MPRIREYIERKTFKREFAAVLMGALIYKIIDGHVEMVEAIIWPILSYVAIAAGLKGYENIAIGHRKPPDPPADK